MQDRAMHMAALALAALALTSCQSKDSMREDVVRCQGFSMPFVSLSLGGNSPVGEIDSALQKRGITAADTMGMGTAAMQYMSAMDPARAQRLTQEGSAAANDLIRKKDGNGIVDYFAACVKTYKDLAN